MRTKSCTAENCPNPARTAGMCPRHYEQARRGSEPRKAYGDREIPKCAVSHCSNEAHGFKEGSYCEPHYQLSYRGVDPETRILRVNDSHRTDRKCWCEGCPKRVTTKGLCNYHYRRARMGKLEVPESLGVTLNPVCSFETCTAISAQKGLCHSHYEQLRQGKELGELRDYGKYTKGEHVCGLTSCRKVAVSSGLCANHKTLQAQYKISVERMIEIWENPVCENPGCGETKRLHMDHDHATGQFRGLLCNGCNASLGFLKESQDRIDGLKAYISRFQ